MDGSGRGSYVPSEPSQPGFVNSEIYLNVSNETVEIEVASVLKLLLRQEPLPVQTRVSAPFLLLIKAQSDKTGPDNVRINMYRISENDSNHMFVSVAELDKLTNQLVSYVIQYESAEPIRLFFLPYQELMTNITKGDIWVAIKTIRRLSSDMMTYRAKAFPTEPIGKLDLHIISDPLDTQYLPIPTAAPLVADVSDQQVQIDLLIPSATLPPGMQYQPFDFEDNATWDQLFGQNNQIPEVAQPQQAEVPQLQPQMALYAYPAPVAVLPQSSNGYQAYQLSSYSTNPPNTFGQAQQFPIYPQQNAQQQFVHPGVSDGMMMTQHQAMSGTDGDDAQANSIIHSPVTTPNGVGCAWSDQIPYVPLYIALAYIIGQNSTPTDTRRWLNRAKDNIQPQPGTDTLSARVVGALPRTRYVKFSYIDGLVVNRTLESFIPKDRIGPLKDRECRLALLRQLIAQGGRTGNVIE